MFYLYDVFKRPQTPHNDILFDYRDLVFDGHWFFYSHGLPFELWCLKFEVYNQGRRNEKRAGGADFVEWAPTKF